MLGFHFVDNVVVVVFLNVDCFSLHVQCVVERDCFPCVFGGLVCLCCSIVRFWKMIFLGTVFFYHLRELRALLQGRLFTHVMAIEVERQCRGCVHPGSDFDDCYTDLRPQVSET